MGGLQTTALKKKDKEEGVGRSHVKLEKIADCSHDEESNSDDDENDEASMISDLTSSDYATSGGHIATHVSSDILHKELPERIEEGEGEEEEESLVSMPSAVSFALDDHSHGEYFVPLSATWQSLYIYSLRCVIGVKYDRYSFTCKHNGLPLFNTLTLHRPI